MFLVCQKKQALVESAPSLRLEAANGILAPMNALELALNSNDLDKAFVLLVGEIEALRQPQLRAGRMLELAQLYVLAAGDPEAVDACLLEAKAQHPPIAKEPLFLALQAGQKLSRLTAPPALDNPVRIAAIGLATQALVGDATARYYAASVLLGLGELEAGLQALEGMEALPTHLRWRGWSWRATALEEIGRLRDASLAHQQAIAGAPNTEKAVLLQDKAALHLDLEEPHEALAALAESLNWLPEEYPEDAATRLTLEARAHLMLENPRLARERAEQAKVLEQQIGDPSFGTMLVLGQCHAALENWREAIPAFEAAVGLAFETEKGFALHELGLAQMDAEQSEDSRRSLQNALLESNYPHKAEIHADLAELEYRLGNFEAAEVQAKTALEMGATVSASLLLANIAYEYYRLDEALEHYGRAWSQAPEASRDWVISHQMTADTLVQLGWRNPESILHHASLALPHLEPADEWAITLQSYIERARQLLTPSSGSRTLN
jgi:tetratricopeptide (TPR) repeat protein